MSQPTLFTNLKTTDELLGSVERLAATKMSDYHLAFSLSKKKDARYATGITFLGTDKVGKTHRLIEACDSIPQGIYLVEEFLTKINIK
jgi:hypothetical protein